MEEFARVFSSSFKTKVKLRKTLMYNFMPCLECNYLLKSDVTEVKYFCPGRNDAS